MILDSIPLFTSIIGIFLLLMILVNKGSLKNNGPARITLSAIVLLMVHSQLDAYFYFAGFTSEYIGISYLHHHLIGGLFLIYTYQLFKIKINLKLWGAVLIGFTLLRIAVLLPVDPDTLEETDTISPVEYVLILDAFVSNMLNIVGLGLAFLKIRGLKFAVQLDGGERMAYLWLKNLLLISTFIYLLLMVSMIISLMDYEEYLFYWKIESAVLGSFFFALAFFAIRFPVFSVYGDFRDLQPEAKKYANSSLKNHQGLELWQKIQNVMQEEKPYRDPEYRLNELAESTGGSVHHVSQVINEQKGASFNDFINYFRVLEAQDLLTSDRAKEITILAISLEVGFNSKTAFYNAFKKHTGKTPREFKRDQESVVS